MPKLSLADPDATRLAETMDRIAALTGPQSMHARVAAAMRKRPLSLPPACIAWLRAYAEGASRGAPPTPDHLEWLARVKRALDTAPAAR